MLLKSLIVLLLLIFPSSILSKGGKHVEDRPRLIVHQNWEGEVLCEGKSFPLKITIYNAGSAEAQDVRITLPISMEVENAVTFESLAPGARVSKVLQVSSKITSLPQLEAAARVEYRGKGSNLDFIGQAIPSKDFIVLSPEEYHARTNKHSMEWLLWFLLSFGVGVVFPGFKVLQLRIAAGEKIDFLKGISTAGGAGKSHKKH